MPPVTRNASKPLLENALRLMLPFLLMGCGAVSTRIPDVPAPMALAITSITPDHLVAGTGPASLTLAGTGFTRTTVVRLGNIIGQTTFLSGTRVAVVVSAAQTANGAVLAVVATDGVKSTIGAASPVKLEIDNPAATIASLTPADVPVGVATTPVMIQGTGFLSSTAVEVNGVSRQISLISGTQISVLLQPDDLARAGTLTITAANPAPAGGQSNPVHFAVDNPSPGPLALNPSSILAYSPSPTTILVSGSNFVPDSTVSVNGVARATQYTGLTQLSFQLTVADQASTGTLSIAATNRSPGGGNSAAAGLTLSNVVYASSLPGVVSDSVLTPGAQVTGADQAERLQAVLNRGGIHLIIDGRFTLDEPLLLYSHDQVEILQGSGLIMGPSSNCEMFLNAHQNAPTTPSGTGGFLVSNQIDQDISVINYGTLNFNSTGGAITGTDSLGGNNVLVAHKTDPVTGKQINGMRFTGVNGLAIVAGELYDSGTFTITFANDSHVDVGTGYLHHPLPIVQGKNTDGLHFFGPDDAVHVHDLDIASGDDALALNADDIHEPQTYNFSGTAYRGVLHGPITNVQVERLRLLGSLSGVRLLSLTELIDGIALSRVTGTTLGPSFVATKFFASGGLGNFGTVSIDAFNVQSLNEAATRRWDPIQAGFELDGNWNKFTVTHLDYTSTAGVPLLRYGSGRMRTMTLNGLSSGSMTPATMPAIFQIGGNVDHLTVADVQVKMPSDWTGTIFAGTSPPTLLTVAGYSGPSALLASVWNTTSHDGDAFPFATGGITRYALRTSFDEGAPGEPLIGTSPATGSGPWLQPTGPAPAFVVGGIDVPHVGAGDAATIDIGLANGVINYTLAAIDDGWSALALRYIDRANFIMVILRSSHAEAYDITRGLPTLLCTTTWFPPLNSPMSVMLRGSSITLSDGVHPPATGVLPPGTANLVSTRNGFLHFGGVNHTMILSGMSVTP